MIRPEKASNSDPTMAAGTPGRGPGQSTKPTRGSDTRRVCCVCHFFFRESSTTHQRGPHPAACGDPPSPRPRSALRGARPLRAHYARPPHSPERLAPRRALPRARSSVPPVHAHAAQHNYCVSNPSGALMPREGSVAWEARTTSLRNPTPSPARSCTPPRSAHEGFAVEGPQGRTFLCLL